MANIKVAVRVRPISARELNLTGSEVVVRTDLNEVSLTNLKVSSSKAGDSRERTRRYGFDYCFDSSDPEAKNYATQAKIYETLGQSVLDALFSGYNSCLVAYGQSASGKTYTMMGSKDDPGLTPRLCEGLFSRIEQERRSEKVYRVSVSYLEIYNEKVRDLLKPSTSASGLRVREHPRLGPYVQGLTHHAVRTLGSLMSYVEEGTKARKTASTLQNPSSSRSHALLTVALSPESVGGVGTPSSRKNDVPPRGSSKLHLVDLAGSESAATCSGVHRLKEGANINKSLVALGNVISALAERSSAGSSSGRRFIPYRDSSLTWLLKDALGGNATTIMLATISPASGSYNETAHTLRFAQRAQSVVNRPVVNEDPVERIIRELREEIARLKSLLLEKNVDSESRSLCCCKKEQNTEDESNSRKDRPDVTCSRNGSVSDKQVETEERSNTIVRKFNSSENLTVCGDNSLRPIRKFGSYEYLSTSELAVRNYKRAKVTELKDEEDEINEINEPVFVDIPTLVAVLIKPDDSLQEASAQIEEICSDEVQEDAIDAEFIERRNEGFEEAEKPGSIDHDELSSSANSYNASGDAEAIEAQTNSVECSSRISETAPGSREKGRIRKQDSIDADTPISSLHSSKRFGSVETLQRRKDPLFSLERSHTSLEKRPAGLEKTKKLNNIREIDDQRSGRTGNIWRAIGGGGSKDHLQRKGSNDSDKSLKDSNNLSKAKSFARKSSLENLKRKTSKDSSSSSSKEEQILISSLARDKLLRRKNSLDQEPLTVRPHTPIQRAKRSEIVAAVTERLYSSRKHVDDTPTSPASGFRSPPEGTDVKLGSSPFAGRSKLQEISRKMLAKRRRVCVDTQTEAAQTIRMKDTASLTEEPRIELQEVGVLTDVHENCELAVGKRIPTLRVKETATLTDRPRTNIVRCKDVGSLANDLEDYECEIQSPRNDSGVLSDDAQNYAESNLSSGEVSDLCRERERRAAYAESSTNTFSSPGKSSAVQTPSNDVTKSPQTPVCNRQCCNSSQEGAQSPAAVSTEKNVISISLPDMINIVIESPNALESKIAVMDTFDSVEDKVKSSLKDRESQTEGKGESEDLDLLKNGNHFSFQNFSVRPTGNQSDGKVFRIENIFQDPNTSARASKADAVCDTEDSRKRNSVTFRNSLGTSPAPETRDGGTDMEQEKMGRNEFQYFQIKPFVQDGSITEAFVSRRQSLHLNPERQQASYNLWKNWTIANPNNPIEYFDRRHKVGFTSRWEENLTNNFPYNNFVTPVNNCTCKNKFQTSATSENGYEEPKVNVDIQNSDNQFDTKSELTTAIEFEHNFSDDSLDYDTDSEKTILGTAKLENQEAQCPPDVVAHTKKDNPKQVNYTETGTMESYDFDFDDTCVELPKTKVTDSSEELPVSMQHYKSLILGRPTYIFNEAMYKDNSDVKSSSNATSITKKRVSFSPFERDSEERKGSLKPPEKLKQTSSFNLKSIIKGRKDTADTADVVRSSNDESDDTTQDEKTDFQKLRKTTKEFMSSEETLPSSPDNQDSDGICKSPRKLNYRRTRSPAGHFESDSDTCEDTSSDEDCLRSPKRTILEEYLDEAVTFMRNMNSINEYMSATSMFERYFRRKRRKSRQKGCSPKDLDYIEFEGRKISLEDDTDKYLKQEDDIVISTASYENCLKRIERLESCIAKVSKHDELLREKYGIDVESAGVKLSLASSNAELKMSPSKRDDSTILKGRDASSGREGGSPGISDLSASDKTGLTKKDESDEREDKNNNANSEARDDLEKRIFDQLMNAVDSRGYWSIGKARRRESAGNPRLESSNFDDKSEGIQRNARRDSENRSDANRYSYSASSEREGTSKGARKFSARAKRSHGGMTEEEHDPCSFSGEFMEAKAPQAREYDKLSVRGRLRSTTEINDAEKTYAGRMRVSDEEDSTDGDNGFLMRSKNRLNLPSRSEANVKISSLRNNNVSGAESADGLTHSRDKLKYPGSPRARLLELLKERRRIVESSRSSAS